MRLEGPQEAGQRATQRCQRGGDLCIPLDEAAIVVVSPVKRRTSEQEVSIANSQTDCTFLGSTDTPAADSDAAGSRALVPELVLGALGAGERSRVPPPHPADAALASVSALNNRPYRPACTCPEAPTPRQGVAWPKWRARSAESPVKFRHTVSAWFVIRISSEEDP